MDFLALPIKLTSRCEYPHQILYKPNNVKKAVDSNIDHACVLFVTNIPIYCAKEDVLISIFSQFGKINSVHIHRQPTLNFTSSSLNSYSEPNDINYMGFKVAYIVFTSAKAVKSAMDTKCVDPIVIRHIIPAFKCGYQGYLSDYLKSFPDEQKTLKDIEDYLREYDRKNQEEDRKAENVVADEEGWIQVTTKSKIVANEKKLRRKRKSKKKYLQNFYSFQIKESRMQKIAELRKKFEEDRKAIAEMKLKRKFKPL
ncbi:hypothetical protein GJ496_004139 [Pomphorhynchus laevis]|nr:hypothetical protein GJ496_004139 [Pomphorhynchus laevis]